MKTIYAVTSGEYSDYSVHCLFSDRALAQEFCDHHNDTREYDNYDVEEFCLYDDMPKKYIHYRSDITRGKVRVWNHESFDFEGDLPPRRPKFSDWNGFLRWHGSSEESVRKAASDYLAQMKAREAGI